MTPPTSEQHLVQPLPSAVMYSSLTNAIASRASEDRYIVLAMLDEAFVDMALNFHETSLSRHHIDNYLFVGVGSSTCDVLYRHSLACFYYVDDRSSGEASEFGDTDFIRKMNIRTDMILEALAANFTVVHTDTDVIFLANPLREIKVILQLNIVIQPYGSMGDIYFTVCYFVLLFVCTVTDFSAVEKARGVKFCMHQNETWQAGRHRSWSHSFRWEPSSPSPNGHSPQFSAHICCCQMAAWIKMTLGIKVGFGPGHIVLDGDPAPPKGAQPPIFGLFPL